MKPEAARQRIEAFTKRFGDAHKYLAYHASFPLALTPDLLYCLWANFQRDVKGVPLGIPWVAVADLLLSGLCDEVANETYEMNIAVRDELLGRLQAEARFGPPRIEELSEFLFDYVRQQVYSDDPDVHDFAQAQQWTALAYTKPGEAAEEIAKTLAGLGRGNRAEHLRMVSVLETLKQPLSEFTPLLSYARGMGALSLGQTEKAASHFGQAAPQGGRQVQVAQTTLTIPVIQRVAQSPPTTVVTETTIPPGVVTTATPQTVTPTGAQKRPVFILVSDYPGQAEAAEFFLHTVWEEIKKRLDSDTPYSYVRDNPRHTVQSLDEIQQQLLSDIPFFIPIITPHFFDNPRCRQELEFFIEREKAARATLIYPVYLETAPPLEARGSVNDTLAYAIATHGWTDIRWLNVGDELERKPLEEMAVDLASTLSGVARVLQRVPAVEPPRVSHQETQSQEIPAVQTSRGAETPERERGSIAFVSYTHHDNQGGRLTQLINLLSDELHNQTGEEFPLVWDENLLKVGDKWEERLQQARENAAFLIPILTPSYFESQFCRAELSFFLERERSFGRTGLICPILYIETRQLTGDSQEGYDFLAQVMSARLFADWREIRFQPLDSPAVHEAIAKLASDISHAWRNLQVHRDEPRPADPDDARRTSSTFEEKLKALESVSLSSVFTPDELAELAVSMGEVRYVAGQKIVGMYQPNQEMYIIKNGTARVMDAAGKNIVLSQLDAGDDFGKRSMLLGDIPLASVVAQTDEVHCYVINRESLRPILQRRPEIVDDMGKILPLIKDKAPVGSRAGELFQAAEFAARIRTVFQLEQAQSAPASKSGSKSDKAPSRGTASQKAAKTKTQTQVRKDKRKPSSLRKKHRDRPAFSAKVKSDQSAGSDFQEINPPGMIEDASSESPIYRFREAARASRAASARQAAASKKRSAKSSAKKTGASKSAASKSVASKSGSSKSGSSKSQASKSGSSKSPAQKSAGPPSTKRIQNLIKKTLLEAWQLKVHAGGSSKSGAKRGAKSSKSAKGGRQMSKKK